MATKKPVLEKWTSNLNQKSKTRGKEIGKQQANVQQSVAMVCALLEKVDVDVVPEVLRQAKFDQSTAVEKMIQAVAKLISLKDVCDRMGQSPERKLPITSSETIKYFASHWKYPELLTITSSKSLLIFFGWILSRSNLLTRLILKFSSILDKDLPPFGLKKRHLYFKSNELQSMKPLVTRQLQNYDDRRAFYKQRSNNITEQQLHAILHDMNLDMPIEKKNNSGTVTELALASDQRATKLALETYKQGRVSLAHATSFLQHLKNFWIWMGSCRNEPLTQLNDAREKLEMLIEAQNDDITLRTQLLASAVEKLNADDQDVKENKDRLLKSANELFQLFHTFPPSNTQNDYNVFNRLDESIYQLKRNK